MPVRRRPADIQDDATPCECNLADLSIQQTRYDPRSDPRSGHDKGQRQQQDRHEQQRKPHDRCHCPGASTACLAPVCACLPMLFVLQHSPTDVNKAVCVRVSCPCPRGPCPCLRMKLVPTCPVPVCMCLARACVCDLSCGMLYVGTYESSEAADGRSQVYIST